MISTVSDWRYAQLAKIKIVLPGGEEGILGSGFVLADGLVLTARHVLKQLTGNEARDASWWELANHPLAAIRVSPPEAGAASHRVERVVALETAARLDAVVLHVPEMPGLPVRNIGAQLVGADPLEGCRIVGFPVAATDNDSVRPEWVSVRAIPVSGESDGQVALDVTSAQPGDRTWWKGISGAAALDSQGRLLGLVTSVRGRIDGRFVAVGTATLVDAAQAMTTAARAGEGRDRESDETAALAALARLPVVEVGVVDELFDPDRVPVSFGDLAGRSLFRILNYRSQVVPFVAEGEHARLRDQITTWAAAAVAADPNVGVMVLTGPAGSGKSRLAARICADLAGGDDSWRAGFADPGRTRDASLPQAPLFAVFDYAEHAPDLIGAYIARLQRHQERRELRAPVRVLLIARSLGAWWHDRLLGQVEDTAMLGGEMVKLEADRFTLETRLQHARVAFEAFSAGLDQPSEFPDGLDAYAASLDRPLAIHIAALLAAGGDRSFLDQPGPAAQDNLLGELLHRESRRWRRYGRTPDGNDSDFLTFEAGKEALAIATLTAPTLSHFRDLLQVSATFAGTDSERRTTIAEVLHDLYPGPPRPIEPDGAPETRLAPVEPDLLAAYLLATTRERTHLITGLIDSPILAKHRAYHARILEALSAAADSYPAIAADLKTHLARSLSALVETPEYAASGLSGLLARHLASLVHAAVARATDQDLSAARQLTLALALSDHLDQLNIDKAASEVVAAAQPPYPHHGLAGLGTAIAERALAYHERNADLPQIARGHGTLGAWMGENGRGSDGLIHSELAVSIHDQLTSVDREAYLPDLAISVNNLAIRLGENGRLADALMTAERAVALVEELSEHDPTAHLPALAASVTNLAADLARTNRRNEALRVAERAVSLYEELTEQDRPAFLPNLAASLNTLAAELSDAGRDSEALAVAQRSIDMGLELVSIDRLAHLPGLAMSVQNIGVQLSKAGRPVEALAAAKWAVTLYEELAESNRGAHLLYLATATENLARDLASVGRRAKALPKAERAVAMWQELTERTGNAHLPNLARSLTTVANHLNETGRPLEAMSAVGQAVALYENLTATDRATYLPDLAKSVHNLAVHSAAAGHREEALAAANQAVRIWEELTESNRSAYLPELASSVNSLAARLAETGRQRDALVASERAVGLYEELTEADPPVHRSDLAMSVYNLAIHLTSAGRMTDALGAAKKAATIYMELAANGGPSEHAMLAAAQSNLAVRLANVGQGDEALAIARQAVAMREELATADRPKHLPHLASSVNNLALHLREIGLLTEALSTARRAVTLYEELIEANQDIYLSELAGSIINLSVLLANSGQQEEALAACERAAAFYESLAQNHRAVHLPGLAKSLWATAWVHQIFDTGTPAAIAACDQAITYFRELFEHEPDTFREDLDAVTQMRAALVDQQHPR